MNGHQHARHYPIATVYEESELVSEHINRHLVSEAVTMQLAVAGVFDKKANGEFKKHCKKLRG